jgi:hypothetical protein
MDSGVIKKVGNGKIDFSMVTHAIFFDLDVSYTSIVEIHSGG